MNPSFPEKIKRSPFVTLALIIANVAVFLVVDLSGPSESGQHLLSWGAMLTSALQEKGEYWRLFTSMFLHFGIMHLGSNMLVLFALGSLLEKGIGHLRLGLIYLISGLGANVFSYLWDVNQKREVVSAGASGAVFGLMGAVVFAGLFAKEWIGSLSPAQVIAMLVLSLYHGVNEAIDDAAHLSGLFIGFILAILLLKLLGGYKRGPKRPL